MMRSLFNTARTAVVDAYTFARHPRSIPLKLKGIKYEHYRDLNKPWITNYNISTVLDIGANIGDFAKLAREVFADSIIYSFEPLPSCFTKLTSALHNDPKFIPINTGVGSKKDDLNFYVSYHTPSSSFLKMCDSHKEAYPESIDGQSDQSTIVLVDTLDSLLANRILELNVLMKIDVQGYELEVISGAMRILESTKVIIIEMSYTKLYEGGALFHEVYSRLYELGFAFKGNLAQMAHAKTGEIVQSDSIFVRE